MNKKISPKAEPGVGPSGSDPGILRLGVKAKVAQVGQVGQVGLAQRNPTFSVTRQHGQQD